MSGSEIDDIFATPPRTEERKTAIRRAVGFTVGLMGTNDGERVYLHAGGLTRPALETEARLFAALWVAPQIGGGSPVGHAGPEAEEGWVGWPPSGVSGLRGALWRGGGGDAG